MAKAGRKKKNKKDKVVSKGVYLTRAEWLYINKRYGSGTKAIRTLLRN